MVNPPQPRQMPKSPRITSSSGPTPVPLGSPRSSHPQLHHQSSTASNISTTSTTSTSSTIGGGAGGSVSSGTGGPTSSPPATYLHHHPSRKPSIVEMLSSPPPCQQILWTQSIISVYQDTLLPVQTNHLLNQDQML